MFQFIRDLPTMDLSSVLNWWDDKGVVVKTAKAKRKFGLLNTMTTGWKTSYLTPEIGIKTLTIKVFERAIHNVIYL